MRPISDLKGPDLSTRLRIVVGVTGGIAAYKVVSLVRSLVLAGHDVHVVPTEAALRFVGVPTWEAISRNEVSNDLYARVSEVRHVALGQSADLIIIAPATANSIAKFAHGIADDLLGTTVLASTAPVIIAPAMHTEMWQHAATQANIATLRERGVTVVEPGVGRLTGNDSGVGRLADSGEIISAALALVDPGILSASEANLVEISERDLAGLNIVITAGGTREPLDPVRFLGNRSSGKQGVALAIAAVERGARVTLIGAHLDVAVPVTHEFIDVHTTAELQAAVLEAAARADHIIMAAAVADYRPADVSETKLKKSVGDDGLVLSFVRTPDILATLPREQFPQLTVTAFAAETVATQDELLVLARAKRVAKNVDFVVANQVDWERGFGADTNDVTIVGAGGTVLAETSGSKMSVAHAILDIVTA